MASLQLLYLFIFFLTQASILGCAKEGAVTEHNGYDSMPLAKTVTPLIAEASGMADSKKNKGFLWVQEDSGNPPQLYLLGHNGTVAKTIALMGIVNRDWEELQLAGDSLYLADIGDNQAQHQTNTIYVFAEPAYSVNEVTEIKAIQFRYADGQRDAEAFLVDEHRKDIYIITKSDKPSRIYKLAHPYSTTTVNTALQVGKLDYGGVVAAAMSSDSREIIIKTYASLQHYRHDPGASIAETLQKPYEKLPYQMEPQGEAVAFAADGSGYFTLSEKGLFGSVKLFFYKRN